jgi:hypothetical protein
MKLTLPLGDMFAMNRSKFLAFTAIIPCLLILASPHPVSAHVSTGDSIGLSSGFITATILLHAIGMAIGYAIDRFASLRRQQWFQFGGTAILIVATYAAIKL